MGAGATGNEGLVEDGRLNRAQKQLIGFVVVLAVANISYRLVYATDWARTGALFVGVPAILVIGLALLPRAGSATGMLFKGATMAMLLACVVLPEGLLCLLFALPLVGLVAAVVGGTIDYVRARRRRQGPTLMVVALPLLLLSMEGVVESPFPTAGSATATVVVDASPGQVAAALAEPPVFERPLPPFLRLGFNRPVAASGQGLDVGDRRRIDFAGGTTHDHPVRPLGLEPLSDEQRLASMELVVSEAETNRVVFTVTSDHTMLARWARLERAVVEWEETGDGRTRVSWRFEYERLVQPTFYFGPLQRFGMEEAAGYLLQVGVADRVP